MPVLEQRLEMKVIMSIISQDIHKSYSNTFFMRMGYVALANMFPWVVEEWNSS
jgi:hypothetical protein